MIYSIKMVAERLGVTPPAVRYWIWRDMIPKPRRTDGAEDRGFSEEQIDEIERWYLKRAAGGFCRGSGAEEKQRRAAARLREQRSSDPNATA